MEKPALKALVPDQVGVKYVTTDELTPNPHNPRMLFDRAPLDVLKDSINKVGILVPLTVYWSPNKKSYVILDGQRRWTCARELKLKKVPVNQVAEPTLVQNIVTMFQIHKLREDWELMPTALKLEVLIKELKETNEKKLAALTGLDPSVVSRCKKLLTFEKKYQDMMLDLDPVKRVKADFFIELYAIRNDRTVKQMEWFAPVKFTTRMLEKYQKAGSGVKAVTDFRIMKQHISNAARAGKTKIITRKLQEFTFNDNLTLEHLVIKAADVTANARKLFINIEKLHAEIDAIDAEEYYGEENLWKSLESLLKVIKKKLNEADRRLP